MDKKNLIISGVVAAVSVTVLLTALILNTGPSVSKGPSFANGELELVGEPYFLGDMIRASGLVNDPNIDFVTIEVLDSKKNIMAIEKYGVGGFNGHFDQSFDTDVKRTNVDWEAGDYTVRVAGDRLELLKPFHIDNPPKDQA